MRRFDTGMFEQKWTQDIVDLLEMDEIAPDLYRNRHNQPNAYRALFGGQIVAQALRAADLTAEGRSVHSLHCYFLRGGREASPIDFAVERTRDGARFSTRRVVARQDGQIIFTMQCSYRVPIDGFSHYRPMSVAFEPEKGMDERAFDSMLGEANQRYAVLFKGRYPVELRLPGPAGFLERVPDAKRHYWLRAPGAERVDDPAVHRQIFAFLSDFMFAGAPLSRHTVALPGPHLFVASLDHCVWFHRDMRCDDWLLFETEGPNAQNGVNMARGHVYNRAGELVASLAQEALQYPVEEEAS